MTETTPSPSQDFFGEAPHRTIPFRHPTVYVLTGYQFNHLSRGIPIDLRFASAKDHVFYFFDQNTMPLARFPRPHLFEIHIAPEVADLGRRHIAEWSFFLMEYRKKVLNYPFYAISSRFYEKNARLDGSLDDYLPAAFAGLEQYGYGYLPSYDRDLSFIDVMGYFENNELGMTVAGLDYIGDKFNVDMRGANRFFSDFWCNYIGFATRKHFEAYMEFYLPILEEFFTETGEMKKDYMHSGLVRDDVNFRELKPLSLLLELSSHLFFVKNEIPFFGLHYDGTFEVREWERTFVRLLGNQTQQTGEDRLAHSRLFRASTR